MKSPVDVNCPFYTVRLFIGTSEDFPRCCPNTRTLHAKSIGTGRAREIVIIPVMCVCVCVCEAK